VALVVRVVHLGSEGTGDLRPWIDFMILHFGRK
jgi:hypothetical protein